jgi:DNA-binding transcriptional ArsR family regulator
MADGPRIPEIDALLHEPARLRILGLLSMVDRADFMYILRTTGLSRGNLSVQLGKLEEAGILGLERELVGARPRTTYFLTEPGRRRLREYQRVIHSLVDRFG